jgi:hypothetical protein
MEKRCPRRFYDDHRGRDLPTPPALCSGRHWVMLDTTHPDMPELVSDARHYADPYGPDGDGCGVLRRAARALLKALGAR